MAEDEIKGLSESIKIQRKKEIQLAYEKSKKLLQSMHKNSEKVKEGCKKLVEETEPKLTEEGMKKIKFRSQFESLKVMNALAHSIDKQFLDFQVPEASKRLTSIELNQFIRDVSRLLNDINKEKNAADSVMGIDFMLKKRTIYNPISKLGSELAKLRDLQKEEYRIIKALEDLADLNTDVKDLLQKISKLKEEQNQIQTELKTLEESLTEAEKEKTRLSENPSIKVSRKSGIRMTELEIEIGRHLNSFKKIFKKYAREIQRGSISGDFGIVNTALAYEKNPVQSFLEEEEGNPEIIALMEELIKVGKTDLHLKQKNINNLTHELNALQEGKMDSKKNEWKDHLAQKEELEGSSEFKSINDLLIQCEENIAVLKADITEKEEEMSLNRKNFTQSTESLSERRQRAKDIATEVLETKD
ncbi:MAG: coiled-coil domain-containing protein [Promethearchaeota archaeon]